MLTTRTRRTLLLTGASLALGLAAGCGGGDPAPEAGGDAVEAREGAPLVVCTTVMVADLVREIAADDLDVRTLLGPEVDPHLFRPTRDDVALLTRADLVVYSGFHLEGYLQENIDRLEGAAKGPRVMALCDAIAAVAPADKGIDPVDPHLWMDPSLWALACTPIAQALAEVKPGAEGFGARAAQLEERLGRLDRQVADLMETVPEASRVLVTAHDAFHYFGRRYGVDVHAVQGMSTASEEGLRAIEELVDLIVTRRIQAVFFESTVSDRSVKSLVEGAKARGHDVSIGGTLHSDAPGSAGSYEGMIRHNAQVIASALRGEGGE